MTIIAGIDEAGLGPVLGPLLVAATAFEVPAELADIPMWQTLSSCVSRKVAKHATRIAIADSKKLYSRQKPDGIVHLERGVLTMLAAADRRPRTLLELLAAVAPGAIEPMKTIPWYSHEARPLPRLASATSIDLSCNGLAVGLAQAGISPPLTMRAEVTFEGEFNRLIGATDNKSVTLFDITSRLLMHLWKLSAGKDLKVFVDRQGGRMHYLPALQRLFEGCQFKIIEETERLSAYRISDGRRIVEIHFMVECEDQQLPVALASMLCKYLRELFMELLNSFWSGHVPQIAPTAGYYVDGQRFYREIQAAAGRLGVTDGMIYRCR